MTKEPSMDMNYYFYKNVCPSCGRGEQVEHIGKSSAGWPFLLHACGLFTTVTGMLQAQFLGCYIITDETGTRISTEELLEKIYVRQINEDNNIAMHEVVCKGTTWVSVRGDFL